jgi:hypothetical protein
MTSGLEVKPIRTMSSVGMATAVLAAFSITPDGVPPHALVPVAPNEAQSPFVRTDHQQTRVELVTRTTARTELGRRLLAARQKIVASGVKLLNWDEVRAEVAANRGGAD